MAVSNLVKNPSLPGSPKRSSSNMMLKNKNTGKDFCLETSG